MNGMKQKDSMLTNMNTGRSSHTEKILAETSIIVRCADSSLSRGDRPLQAAVEPLTSIFKNTKR